MFGAFFYSIKQAVRRTTFSLGAALLMSVGLAFLTVAGWIFLAELQGAMMAALIIGCVYFGLGLIALAIGSMSRPVPASYATQSQAPSAGSPGGIASALMQGIGAGLAAGAAKSAGSGSHRPEAPPPPPYGHPGYTGQYGARPPGHMPAE